MGGSQSRTTYASVTTTVLPGILLPQTACFLQCLSVQSTQSSTFQSIKTVKSHTAWHQHPVFHLRQSPTPHSSPAPPLLLLQVLVAVAPRPFRVLSAFQPGINASVDDGPGPVIPAGAISSPAQPLRRWRTRCDRNKTTWKPLECRWLTDGFQVGSMQGVTTCRVSHADIVKSYPLIRATRHASPYSPGPSVVRHHSERAPLVDTYKVVSGASRTFSD